MLLTEPVTLQNAYVRLEPLSLDHSEEIAAATVGLEHAWYTSVPTGAGVADDIAQRLAWQAEGSMNPWTEIGRASCRERV